MVVVETKKKLVINTKRHAEVMAYIPHARTFTHDNQVLTAVPHGVEELLVLKNMGFKNVPAPVLHYYDWPGRITPMSHQKDTAAFLVSNRKALCLNSPGCVDADTEYLSPDGWVRIADYAGGKVAQFDPATQQVTFVDAEYVKLPCNSMVRVKTKYGIDQLLSPEHRCLIYSKANPEKFEVVEAAELYRRERERIARSLKTISFSQAAVKTTFLYSGPGFALTDDELRVQIAAIADGYFPSATGNRCVIRIKKGRKKERLRALLQAANLPYTEKLVAPEGFSAIQFYAPRREKAFSAEWYSCTNEQLRIVYDEVQHWDSNVSANPNRGWRFSSYIKASADFVQFACAATGNTARVLVNKRNRRAKTEVEYCVHVRPDKKLLGLHGGNSSDITTAAQSTDGYKYCFMVPSTFLLLRRNGCVFTTGNTGKTISTLWAADFLMKEGAIKKVLIVAPLSTLKPVWGKELAHNFMHRKFAIITGTRLAREEKLEDPDLEFAIINHDGFSTMPKAFKDFDLVIYDEATALKSPSSQRFKKFMHYMNECNPWLWLLTGTPIAQNPTDAWTLAKLVGSKTVPRSFTTFKEMVMQKVTMFKWIPRPGALQVCKEVLQPSIRYDLSECKDLPETVYIDRECSLTPQQAAAYKEMKNEAYIMGADISAANAAVMFQKLVQICCGVVLDNDGSHVRFDDSDRIDTLREILDEIGDKAIVFVPLRGVQERLREHLASAGIDVAVVNGDVSKKDRDDIFHRFQNTEEIQVLLAHPKVAAHGLTLTRSKSIIWYAPIYSLEMYEQANARIRRLTTEGKTVVYHIYATLFEQELYRRLKQKQKVLTNFLGLVRGRNE
jgi:superfamily II DNA or RNA helicase